jgi:uncharacterized protein YecE (DUF72 family)
MRTRSSPTAEARLDLRAGTSGWSYAAWKGTFYPEELPAREMLAWYASRLPAVEVNNTFYRMPKKEVLEGWAAQVPEGFRFVLKASRRITHQKRLRDAEDETAYFLGAARALGARLGALLFQLPPNLGLDLARLDAFLALLREDTRAAFEFRHPSWSDTAVLDRLRARGFAWVTADMGDEPPSDMDDAPPAPLVATAPWAYLRLRRPAYTAADLDGWLAQLRSAPVDEAFVFFKHEDAGVGPRLALELLQRAGAAEPRRPLRVPPRAAAEKAG